MGNNVAEEMHNYLLNNGLYEKYPKPEKSDPRT